MSALYFIKYMYLYILSYVVQTKTEKMSYLLGLAYEVYVIAIAI